MHVYIQSTFRSLKNGAAFIHFKAAQHNEKDVKQENTVYIIICLQLPVGNLMSKQKDDDNYTTDNKNYYY